METEVVFGSLPGQCSSSGLKPNSEINVVTESVHFLKRFSEIKFEP